MNIQIIPMTKSYAEAIVNWKYPSPYDLYNMNGDPDNLSELMNNTYYATENDEHKLITVSHIW